MNVAHERIRKCKDRAVKIIQKRKKENRYNIHEKQIIDLRFV